MVMPAQKTDWTAEMVRALPDDRRRYEVLDGELYISSGFPARAESLTYKRKRPRIRLRKDPEHGRRER